MESLRLGQDGTVRSEKGLSYRNRVLGSHTHVLVVFSFDQFGNAAVVFSEGAQHERINNSFLGRKGFIVRLLVCSTFLAAI